jgi:hypothetical protein
MNYQDKEDSFEKALIDSLKDSIKKRIQDYDQELKGAATEQEKNRIEREKERLEITLQLSDKIFEQNFLFKLPPNYSKLTEEEKKEERGKLQPIIFERIRELEAEVKRLKEEKEKTLTTQNQVKRFLNCIFAEYLKDHKGFIEIREINQRVRQKFYSSVDELIIRLPTHIGNIYFSVCPREEKAGAGKNVKYISALWLDIDVAGTGHKKKSVYTTKEEALEKVLALKPVPSIVISSGSGIHLYWLLNKVYPLDTAEARRRVELILDGLIKDTNGDTIGDLARVMRVPSTWNVKDPTRPKLCEVISINEKQKYAMDDFNKYEKIGVAKVPGEYRAQFSEQKEFIDLNSVPPETLVLITKGDTEGRYKSRSERDQAAAFALVQQGFTDNQVRGVFSNPDYAISDKYLERGPHGDAYLETTIRKARTFKPKALTHYFIPSYLDKELEIYFRGKEGIFSLFKDHTTTPEGDFIFSIEKKGETTGEVIQYVVSGNEFKKLQERYGVHPDIRIMPKYMDEAYLTTLKKVFATRYPSITITLKEKYEDIGKPGRPSGKEERERLLAEELLYSVDFLHYTPGHPDPDRRRFYDRISVNREKGILTVLNIGVALSSLGSFPLDLRKLKEWKAETGEDIKQIVLPLDISRRCGKYAKYQLRTQRYLKKFFRGRAPSLSLSVATYFNEIGVSNKIKSRVADSRELFDTLEPDIRAAIAERGFTYSVERLEPRKDTLDVRGWTLRFTRNTKGQGKN